MQKQAQDGDHHICGSRTLRVKPHTVTTTLALSITADDNETSCATTSMKNLATLAQIPSTLSQLLSDQYDIEFNPTPGSEYQLTFKCLLRVKSKEEVQGSSSKLSYLPQHSPNASQCHVESEGFSTVQVGEWNTLFISTEGAGQGELTVNIEGDYGSKKSQVAITPVGENKHRLKFMLPNAGSYHIHILWGGEDIPGSPFVVQCFQQPQFIISEIPNEVQLGKPLQFTVTPKGTIAEGKLTVTARSSHHGTIAGKVSEKRGRGYSCTIRPGEAGKYLVNIYWNKAPLRGCPFKLKVVQGRNPQKVIARGPGLQDGVVGHQGNFTIDTTDAGVGTLSVNVEGPKGGFKVELNRHPEHKRVLLAQYNPSNAGVYVISITWSGDHIAGSPFTVTINE